MKSEHRHELQTNELSKLTDRAAAFFEMYYNQILWAVVVLMLAGAGWTYWRSSTRNAEASAWTEISSCRNPEDFADVVRKHPRTQTADWAKLHEGDLFLSSGIHDSFSSREKANKDLERAKTAFQDLVNSSSTPDAVRERALFGLGKALESTSDGAEEAAVKAYQTLLDKFPETVYKAEAENRIEVLKTSGAQSFYAWFHSQNPEPPKPTKPKDGEPPSSEKPDPLATPSTLQPSSPKSGSGNSNPTANHPRLDGDAAADSKPPETETVEPKPGDEAKKPATDSKESPDAEPKQGDEKSSAKPDGEKSEDEKKSDPESR